MSLHRLTDITLGVPNVAETVEFYTDLGLLPQPSADPGSPPMPPSLLKPDDLAELMAGTH
ncbi:hypothetical protein N5079_02120 [Planotetraspora sp. A-T 1434]|uniref:hypothetical protein n=1 Tax=Planotetraspora sp. A-T 1434 TaxID=2979219 RepID=UPI0021C2547A|nr:hypothetical protein [Planotetraspora sp. A-T 1434]MCT9929009.1 hypothetical protein [Planotetraspora sp. A-T 1434]